MKKVFVYGTLKENYHNYKYFLSHTTKVGEAITNNPDYNLYCNGAFPYVVKGGNSRINGEVYEVDDKTFEALDALEGYPHHYNRELIPVLMEDGDYEAAWMYIHPRTEYIEEDCRHIEPINGVCNWER
jgi:gamma-glutamylcyclotransferase (GGCT)/AIG2-like uncharacterized protein YtfP